MKTERVAFSLLWGIFLLVAVGAVIYGIVAASEAIVKLAVAVIAAAVCIVGALLNHSLNRLKEQEMEQRRRREENYKTILTQLGEYIRDPSAHRDSVASANLLSWVVGSPEVVEKTIEFLDSVSDSSELPDNAKPRPASAVLTELLLAMRADLGLPANNLAGKSVTRLFPPVKPKATGYMK